MVYTNVSQIGAKNVCYNMTQVSSFPKQPKLNHENELASTPCNYAIFNMTPYLSKIGRSQFMYNGWKYVML